MSQEFGESQSAEHADNILLGADVIEIFDNNANADKPHPLSSGEDFELTEIFDPAETDNNGSHHPLH
jgi:hypothetical protein